MIFQLVEWATRQSLFKASILLGAAEDTAQDAIHDYLDSGPLLELLQAQDTDDTLTEHDLTVTVRTVDPNQWNVGSLTYHGGEMTIAVAPRDTTTSSTPDRS